MLWFPDLLSVGRLYRKLSIRANVQRGGSLTGFRLVLAYSNNDIDSVLGSSVQVVVDNLLDAIGVSGLSIESGAGVVRHHPVTAAQWILHGPPGVVFWGRLDVPNVPGVPVEFTALYCSGDCILIADRAASGVHEPCTLLEVLEQIGIDQPTSALVKWSIDRDNVAFGDEFLKKDLVSDGREDSSRPLGSP